MFEKRYQVFVSSTFVDLRDERRKVIQAILEINGIPAGMEWFPASDASQWELIERVLNLSDYYVVLVAGRYGSVDDAGISFTEREYDHAVARGIPVLAFVSEAVETVEHDHASAKLNAFRAKVMKSKTCKVWSKPEDLPNLVMRSLQLAMDERPAVGWIRGDNASVAEQLAALNSSVTNMAAIVDDRAGLLADINQRVGGAIAKLDDLVFRDAVRRQSTRTYINYTRLLDLSSLMRKSNPPFVATVDALLKEPLEHVNMLSKAKVEVSEHLVGKTFAVLLDALESRYDGVSENDLGFWVATDTPAPLYRHANYNVAKLKTCTRLFVLSESVLENRLDRLVDVLSEQMGEGIDWALAFQEDMRNLALPAGAVLDYGIFDGGKAVSYFRIQRFRSYGVTFRTAGLHTDNDAEIETQLTTYKLLLTQCWISSSGFSDRHLWADSPEFKTLARNACVGRNRKVSRLVNEPEREMIPFFVADVADIPSSLQRMIEVRRMFKRGHYRGEAAG